MFACGAPKYVIAAQLRLIHACLQMQQVVDSFGKKEDLLLSFHAGLASGVVVGGILGLARPKFDLWGGIHLFISKFTCFRYSQHSCETSVFCQR